MGKTFACGPGEQATITGYDANGPVWGCTAAPDPSPSPSDSPSPSPSPIPTPAPMPSIPGAGSPPPESPGPDQAPAPTPDLAGPASTGNGAVGTPGSQVAGQAQAGANAGTTADAQAQTNSPTSNDPVRLATGDLVTTDRDLSISVDGIPLSVTRTNLADRGHWPSVSRVWNFNLDSRVIWGVKPFAARIASDLQAQRATIWNAYTQANNAYTAYLADLRTKIDDIENPVDGVLTVYRRYLDERIAIRDGETAGSGRWNYAEIYVQLAQKVVDEYSRALATLKTARIDFIDQYRSTVDTLYFQWQQKDGEVHQAEEERELSDLNDRRDRYVWTVEQPESIKLVGSGKIVIVDEQGTPWVMSILASPQYNSTARYANGEVNYYPSGSELSGERAGERVWLLADGTVRWKRHDQLVWVYDYNGQLARIEDRWGNLYGFSYDPATHLLSHVSDKRNRVLLSFQRDSQRRIANILDIGGRSVHYGYDAQGRLDSTTDVTGDTVRYEYTSRNLLSKIVKPDGSYRENHYQSTNGRFVVDWQHDEGGNLELFSYQSTYTDYVTLQGVAERHYFNTRFLESRIEYPDGRWVAYTYNAQDLVTSEIRSGGDRVSRDYDSGGNMIYRKNADDSVETWEYDSDNNMTRYTDGRSNTTSIAYTNGLADSVNRPGEPSEVYTYYTDAKLKTRRLATGLVLNYTYDANGYPATGSGGTGAEIRIERYTNDVLGRILTATDAGGISVRYSYYPTGKLKEVYYPDGRLKHYSYNNRKDMIREELRSYQGLGGSQVAQLSESQVSDSSRYELLDWTDYSYDSRHLLTGVANSLGERVVYDYRTSGTLSTLVGQRRIIDATGQTVRTTSYEYDSSARVTSISDTGVSISQPIVREYRYDAAGRVRYVKDGRGVWTRYSYAHALVTAVDVMTSGNDPESGVYAPLSRTSYDRGLVYETSDLRDIRTRYSYDALNRINRVEGFVGGQWSTLNVYDYDPSGQLASRTDGRDNTTTLVYDDWGQKIGERDPFAASKNQTSSHDYTYDTRGLLDSQTDALGLKTTYTWDDMRRITRISTSDSNNVALTTRGIQYAYQNGQLVVADIDERGISRNQTYDCLGRVIQESNGYGKSKRYRYNVYGKIDRYEDETGLVVSIEYDGLGRVTGERRAGVLTGQWSYDGEGKVVSHTDGEGRTTRYSYDAFGRPISEHQGTGGSAQAMDVTYSYSATGRTVTKTVGTFSHVYNYDDLGRVSSETDGLGHTQSYSYDLNGNLVSKTDFNGQTLNFTYDPGNHIARISEGNKELRRYAYDARGAVLWVTNPDTTIGFEYDILGRMTNQTNSDGSSYSYSYDPGGLPLYRRQGNTGPRVRYGYGNEGELLSLVDEKGQTTRFTYDDAMRRTMETRPDGTVISTSFDDTGRISYIKEQTGSERIGYKTTWAEGYVYNTAGQVTLSVDKDGLVTAYGYDEAGRLANAQYPVSGGKQAADSDEMARLGMGRPNVGRWDKVLSAAASDRASADAMFAAMKDTPTTSISWNQPVWDEQFSYDNAGNRASVANSYGTIAYSYDTANRLTQAGNRNYAYDANGNLIREQAGNEITQYQYSWDNRLISYTKAGNVEPIKGSSEYLSISYAYDGLGRRSSRVASDISGASILRQRYTYEGGSFTFASITTESVQGASGLHKSSTGSEGNRYRSVDEFLHSTQSNSFDRVNQVQRFANAGTRAISVSDSRGTERYTADRLGSVRSVTRDGTVGGEYQFDAFGMSIGKNDPALLGYTGKPIDPLTKAYDYGFRDYSPASARFSTVDPIQDGDNWYAYVNNDPVNYIDCWGLSSSDAAVIYGDPVDASEYRQGLSQLSWAKNNQYLTIAGNPTDYWTSKAALARDQYKTSDTVTSQSSGWTSKAGNLKCNVFVDNTLYSDFNDTYTKAGLSLKNANDTAAAWASNPNFERITAATGVAVLQKAQQYADNGYVVAFAYTNRTDSGHVGFVGTSGMTYNSSTKSPKPIDPTFDGKTLTTSTVTVYATAVQAGVFPGAVPINYATNNLSSQISGSNGYPALTVDDAQLKFYLIKQ